MSVSCPRCLTALPSDARACAVCGTRFVPPRSRSAAFAVALLVVVVAAGALGLAWRMNGSGGAGSENSTPAGESASGSRRTGATSGRGANDPTPATEPAAEPTAKPTTNSAAKPGTEGEELNGAGADERGQERDTAALQDPPFDAGEAIRSSIGNDEGGKPRADGGHGAPTIATRDGAGRELRRVAARRVAFGDSWAFLVPLAALNGAQSAHEPVAGDLALIGIDGDELALLAPANVGGAALGAAGETAVETITPFAELTIGSELRVTGATPLVATVVERHEQDALLEVRATGPIARQFLVDERGRLAGVGRETQGDLVAVVVVERALVRLRRARPLSLSLLQEARFSRDPAAQRELGAWYAAASAWEPAVERWLAAIALDPGLAEALLLPVRSAIELALREARLTERVETLLPLLLEAGGRFDREPRVLHACGLALLDLGDPEEALPWFIAADRHARGDDTTFAESLRLAWLHAGEAARADARPADAIALLEEGLARFREDPSLLLALGYAYYELPDRERAAIVLTKAASLNERHAALLAPLLATLAPRPQAADGSAVEIRFQRGGGAVRTRARFGDRADADAIIDTGASLTAISERLAGQLSLDLARPLRQVTVTTANGRVDAPVVLLPSVDVAGARVTHVEAVVLPLAGDDALIGLNFLEHFDLSLDTARGVLRLAAKR
jgi:clan AA aspartic protease (TIGR02281 family)